MSANYYKLFSICLAVDFIQKKNIGLILSLGPGLSLLEYILNLVLGGNVDILVTDFDSFFIDSAKRYLSTAIRADIFDTHHGSVDELFS